MALIYLADIAHSAGTLRYCTGSQVVVGGNSYQPFIKQPAFVGQSISLDSSFGGALSSTVGELVLLNRERSLDSLRSLIIEGYSITLSTYDTVSLAQTTVMVRKIEQVVFEWDLISFRLIDETTRLQKPIQTKLYAGNNSLPAGVEGVLDLKNSPKPLLFGRCANVSPKLVNTSRLIYQISSESIQQVVSVFSNGSYMTPSPITITTFAEFTADTVTNPAAGTFTFYSGTEGSFFRLGMEGGTVTATVWEKISPIDTTLAQVTLRILALAGYTSSDWIAADFTALDAIQGDSVGIFIDSETTVEQALNDLFTGTGCYWGIDSNNKFRVFQFGDFTQTSLGTVNQRTPTDQYGLTTCEIERPSYMGKIAPLKEVKLSYDKNWTVIDKGSQAGIVVVEQIQRSDWLASEWRDALQTTTSSYPLAQQIAYSCFFVSEFAAKAEALRILNLCSVQRDHVNAVIRAPVNFLQALFPGKLLVLTLPRYGWDAGKSFIVLSVENNYLDNTSNLILWG